MATDTTRSIEERLARLERQNRRLKLAGLLLLAAVGAFVLMAQAKPKIDREKADYIFRVQGYLSAFGVEPAHPYALFDSAGTSVGAGSGADTSGMVAAACRDIQGNWVPKGHGPK